MTDQPNTIMEPQFIPSLIAFCNSNARAISSDTLKLRVLSLLEEEKFRLHSLLKGTSSKFSCMIVGGLYAQVRRARSRKTGQLYAAKYSPKRKENLNEIRLLSKLKCPFIITFKDAFLTPTHIVTIMEFAPGGDLQSIIDADIVMLENYASKYIYQLLKGLEYLHGKSIAHLDIKPQNMLLMGDFPNCDIKICDFELSRVVEGIDVREIVGTPDYVAPEILQFEPLSTKSDIWSTGIVAYVLLTGFSPFGADTDHETFNNIINIPIDFPPELFEDVSPCGIDFIQNLCDKKPSSRPTSMVSLHHDWLKSCTMMMRRGKTTKYISKSTFDLSDGKRTKSREKLAEKVIGAGLRKTLSKSREQLWKSKMQLSESTEKIARWASVASFPSLLSEARLEIPGENGSIISIGTNNNNNNTPVINNGGSELYNRGIIIPNFDTHTIVHTIKIESSSCDEIDTRQQQQQQQQSTSILNSQAVAAAAKTARQAAEEQEVQKSVAELILTFGGKAGGSKKKKNLEPIVETCDDEDSSSLSLKEEIIIIKNDGTSSELV